jgi:hypothetical protein
MPGFHAPSARQRRREAKGFIATQVRFHRRRKQPKLHDGDDRDEAQNALDDRHSLAAGKTRDPSSSQIPNSYLGVFMMFYREYPDFAFPNPLWPKGGVGQNLSALISLVRMAARRPAE